MQDISPEDFYIQCEPLIGLPVSYVWRGYGSAIFIEFGELQKRVRADRTPRDYSDGEWTFSIEWSWRIEGKRRIWCGSWSGQERWQKFLDCLLGTKVISISLVGRLQEIDMAFSNGLHLLSMMTAEGNPEWSLRKRTEIGSKYLFVRSGRLVSESYGADGLRVESSHA